jgi:hypothetical protein
MLRTGSDGVFLQLYQGAKRFTAGTPQSRMKPCLAKSVRSLDSSRGWSGDALISDQLNFVYLNTFFATLE